MDQTPENPTEHADPGGPAWMPEQEGEYGGQFGHRPPRGFAAPAWVVIALMAIVTIAVPHFVEEPQEAGDPLGVMLMEMQAKYIVGTAHTLSGGNAGMLLQQSEVLSAGSPDQRQRFVILAAALAGRAEAHQRLEDLDDLIAEEMARPADEPFELTQDQQTIQRILHRLYDPPVESSRDSEDEPVSGDGEGRSEGESEGDGDGEGETDDITPAFERLTQADQDRLRDELGWFGDLALAPPIGSGTGAGDAVLDPAHKVFGLLIGVFIAACCLGVAGFVGVVLLAVFACLGKLRDGVQPGYAHHGLYAETFAVWMVLFLIMQLAAGVVSLFIPEFGMLLVIGGFFASLAALAWPVVRGASWGQVRRDIGWTLDRSPGLEPLIGVGGYAMAIPLLGIGVLLTLLLILIQGLLAGEPGVFESTAGPAHPVIVELAGDSWWPKIQVLLLASVAAPIVEETMFRGVLYRHLRDATRKLGIWGSVLISATINGFVFAVIHPQGWVAIPALMSLAYAFIILREWRGTVIPSIIVHAINNGLIMGMVIALLGA